MDPIIPIVIASVAVLFLGLGAILDDRHVRARRRAQAVGLDVETVLPLLHSINDDRCIGCEACIDVCPTEVLDLVDHKVKVSRFSDCVQCEQCANSCPTMALVMYREGTTPRMLTVPELDEHFQTAVPGQYLIGEIAGKPLVKNAANLGRAVIEHIAKDLGTQPRAGADVLDVVIVGSGPAGLSAGLTCLKLKIPCMVLEKEHIISSTVSRYPKGKHFMAEPVDSLNMSLLPVFDASKEELVAAWQRVVEGAKLPIRLGEAVETVKRGDDGIFEIKSTVATYRARTVVLATGLRGKPRLLAVPGANLEKVQSLLDDPAEFAGEHVLVVGGGDSAVEGAISLANVGATVTLSYRGDGFKRCKQGNQKRLTEMIAANKISQLLESNVKEFTADAVSIKLKDGTVSKIPNQHAFVLIGADTPVTWLEANNVRFVERPHLYALGSTEEVVRRIAPHAVEGSKVPEDALAIILGKQVHKSAGRRMMSAVEHLRDEFHEVATQVTSAFKLSDLEKLAQSRGHLRTPVSGVKANAPRAALRAGVSNRTGAQPIIPLSRLTDRSTGRATGAESVFAPERTVIAASPFGEFGEERTAIGGSPLRPTSSKKRKDTAIHQKFGAAGGDSTVTAVALDKDLDLAFDHAFDHSDSAVSRPQRLPQSPNPTRAAAAPRPGPPPAPQRRARADAPASTGFEEEDDATVLTDRRIT